MAAPPSSSAPTSPSTAPSSRLPPPQTFDILPPLHALLSRLAPPTTTTAAAAAGEYADQPPLEPHQLAAEASAIKIRIQKARAAVQSLPDMSRSVEEQEAEIRQLEERVRKQREVLTGLKEKAAS
ncbi:hypothetical protein L228DRAFT_98734 [Xylona heveae TC161]|uniref:Mediator of RNA polymerase II transcription subunit 9 n=1 Tax=Xylona heveae (strain CBS 132557 / TC161) TaxID=1328760 RepID=A0A161TQD2_XYLHT|nr:hypothetical protein L228DRAFT_98734 [Xylona heveae TC161]KZF24536.1 hypothetical protein L228DRAFT_98734 [Xylona heveae TC161]